mgnify:CR=1 FL=1|jgi:hypothetical protein
MSVDLRNTNTIDINDFKMAKLGLVQEGGHKVEVELSALQFIPRGC